MKQMIQCVCAMMVVSFSMAPVVCDAGDRSSVDSKVAKIRKWYREIESDTSLKKVELQSKAEQAFNPKLTRFTTGEGKVRKLDVEWGGDHGISHESYYFYQEKLIFIYASDSYWKFAGTGKEDNPDTIDVGSQQRYYFDAGKCIRALAKQAETNDQSKLAELLLKAKNESIDVELAAQDYLQRASAVRQIKTLKDLEKFLDEKFSKGGVPPVDH